MSHVARSNILIYIYLLIFLVSLLVIINDFFSFYLHRWLSTYIIRCLHKILYLYLELFFKKHTEKSCIFFLKKNTTHCGARVKWLVLTIFYLFFMYISWYQSLKWILILVTEAMWVSIPNFNQNKKMLELQRMLKQLKQEVLILFKIKMEALKGTLKVITTFYIYWIMVIRIKPLFDIRARHHIMLGGLEEGKK
jgi:hypothetical protein